MAKISKTIKRLRKEQNITQEALADKIHITRQAISNWENDRTQPDIEALMMLADAFGVEIEELIYGKKRMVGAEPDRERAKSRMRIILAIVGSLFLGLGCVLIFVNFWQDFPDIFKALLSVVPMLAGQAFALFVYKKHREHLLWRESSATVWMLGTIATVALINAVFGIHCGIRNCMFVDIVLCLPIFRIMNAVSPLIVYYYMLIHWSALSGNVILSVLLFAAALLFVFFRNENKEDVRYKYALWLTAIAAPVLIVTQLASEYLFFAVASVFIMYYAMSADNADFTKPAKPIGALCTAAWLSFFSFNSVFVVFGIHDFNDISDMFVRSAIEKEILIYCAVAAAVSVSFIVPGVIIGRESFRHNIYKLLLTSVSTAGLFLFLLFILTGMDIFRVVTYLAAFAFGIILIIKGVRELRFLTVNLGLIMTFLQILFIIAAVEPNLFVLGVLFLMFGALLIAINKKLSVHKKEKALPEESKEEKL